MHFDLFLTRSILSKGGKVVKKAGSEAERCEFQVEFVPIDEFTSWLPGLVVTRFDGVVERRWVRTGCGIGRRSLRRWSAAGRVIHLAAQGQRQAQKDSKQCACTCRCLSLSWGHLVLVVEFLDLFGRTFSQ